MAQGAELVDGRVDAIERKLQCMSIEGYAPCNHSTVDLNHVLDAIKENLRLEQRHVMELNIVATHRVLSTVQVLGCLCPHAAVSCEALPRATRASLTEHGLVATSHL